MPPSLPGHAIIVYSGFVANRYDCLVVGAGIVGLAHALAARRAGLRTVVLDRDTQAVGASIRNFGFVTVTGQQAGITWRRARRACEVWADIAPQAGIDIVHRGLLFCARRPETVSVLEEFVASEMGASCRIIDRNGLAEFAPALREDLAGAMYSPHELRVESREAIPRLRAWLEEAHGVTFLPPATALGVAEGRVDTSTGPISARLIVVCPGADFMTLFPDAMVRRGITLCKLHMMRVAGPGFRLPAAIMSDLGLVRYLGYASSPSLPALRARLQAEQQAWLDDGIHLIAVQSADGSLVVGDSHHYAETPDPFQPRTVDDRILQELSSVLAIDAPEVIERWIGVYPSGPDTAFTEAPMPNVRLSVVTSGTGASTAFAIAEETIASLLNQPAPAHVA
jgi:FAD dependent oxidoreductase TIGR03364